MDKDAMITYLIGELKKENLELHDLIVPEELEEKQKLLRALFNTRKPMAASTQLWSGFIHPSKVLFAAFTIASISSLVISPFHR